MVGIKRILLCCFLFVDASMFNEKNNFGQSPANLIYIYLIYISTQHLWENFEFFEWKNDIYFANYSSINFNVSLLYLSLSALFIYTWKEKKTRCQIGRNPDRENAQNSREITETPRCAAIIPNDPGNRFSICLSCSHSVVCTYARHGRDPGKG